MDEIKENNMEHPDVAKFKDLQVPSVLGGEIDALIGIKYAHVHPDSCSLFQIIYKSSDLSSSLQRAKRYSVLGGPLGAMEHIISNMGIK